jgi:lipopolysaccharide transport system ATP-binding protein
MDDKSANWALRAHRVGKLYHVVPSVLPLLTGRAPRADDPTRVVALSEVSLEVARGEAVALIGANGAGKSTFLRILSGLSRPTMGYVECRARLGTLLDLGAGLIDEWTGEMNARSALSLQGIALDRLAEIARFADIGDFLAKPVRTYSTGMRLRLAYALAMASRPEILIADEIVAVGDEAFQRRCALELQRFLAEGGTLVLATHNLYLAEKICRRALWLERGVVRQCGSAHDVTRAYRDAARIPRRSAAQVEALEDTAHDRGPDREQSLTIRRPGAGGGPNVLTTGDDWQIEVRGFDTGRGRRIDVRRVDGTLITCIEPGGSTTIELSSCPLLPGRYVVELCDTDRDEAVRARQELLVRGARRELGNVVLEHEWT